MLRAATLALAAGLAAGAGAMGVVDLCAGTFPVPLDLDVFHALTFTSGSPASGARCTVTLFSSSGEVAAEVQALDASGLGGVLTLHDGPSTASPTLATLSGAQPPAAPLPRSTGTFITLA